MNGQSRRARGWPDASPRKNIPPFAEVESGTRGTVRGASGRGASMAATSRADGHGVIRSRRTSRGKSTTQAPRWSPRNAQPRPRAKMRYTSSARKAQRRATTRARRRASRLCVRSAWRLAALPVRSRYHARASVPVRPTLQTRQPRRLTEPRKDQQRRSRSRTRFSRAKSMSFDQT